jgi:hypothetical protein
MEQLGSGPLKEKAEGYYMEMVGMFIVSHGDLLVYVPFSPLLPSHLDPLDMERY